MRLSWDKLLSEKRIRDLCEGKPAGPRRDHRTEFEGDFDRAIYCTPFRRLHDKAQVFPLEADDSVRTRLAHSLEVSTLARDVAKAISKWLIQEKEISPEQSEHIPVVAATCGLLHDLGNPPFGHAGEDAIREWFSKKLQTEPKFFECFSDKENSQSAQDFLKFEGNAQTIRLISRLQVLADYYGLNPTCGTLSAMCKYLAESNEVEPSNGADPKEHKDHARTKVGYFASEKDLIDKVREEVGTEDARNPITFMVESCDDIVYSIVDVEDGIKKGILRWEEFKKEVLDVAQDKKILQECFEGAKKIIEKPDSVPLKGKDRDIAMAQAFRVVAIGKATGALIRIFKEKYPEIMEGTYAKELIKDSDAWNLIDACKKIGKKYVYVSRQNLSLELMGRKIIHDLMDIFVEGVLEDEENNRFAKKIYALMSSNYRTVYDDAMKKGILPKFYCQMQLVTDYICGMTDTFACQLHRKLTNG